MRNIDYVLIDEETGFVTRRVSVPARLFPPPDGVPAGMRIVATQGNDRLPVGEWQFDLKTVPDAFNIVPSYIAAVTKWRPKRKSKKALLDIAKLDAIGALDRRFAVTLAQRSGPLAQLHAEKRRQAEAGGGPLVADEADRLAILRRAEDDAAAVAAIERKRREIKARLRAANTEDEIKAALAALDGKDAFARGDEARSAEQGRQI